MPGRRRKKMKKVPPFLLFVCLAGSWLAIEVLLSMLIQRTSGTKAPSVTMVDNAKEQKWPPSNMVDLWMDDQRRVVVAASNAEYVDFCDNFAQSLLSLSVTNFVLIALDEIAYERLREKYKTRTIAYFDPTHHTAGEAVFRSQAFRDLTSTRPRFLRPFLEANYTVFYNDIDAVWRQNAWKALPVSDTGKGKPSTIVFGDGPGQLCTCLMYLTPEAIGLVNEWIDEIEKGSHDTDQFAFIDVCKRRKVRFRGGQTDQIVVVRFDPRFPTGKEYDWFGSSKQEDGAVIVHNNWITGKQHKLHRFQQAGLWHPSSTV